MKTAWGSRIVIKICIPEVLRLNLGQDVGCPDGGCPLVSLVSPGKFQGSSWLGHNCFLPDPFQFIIYKSSSIQCYIA
jgi:hypothetical protein